MKTLIITGAGGFLGRSILRAIMSQSIYKVIALSTNPNKLADFRDDKIQIEQADYINMVPYIKDEIFCIINCAYPRNGQMVYEGLSYIETVLKTASNATNVKSVVNISSQSVYDPLRKSLATEETRIVLDSVYSLGKYTTEKLTNIICNDKPHVNIRLASLIGAGFNQRIVNRFINQAIDGRQITAEIGKQTFGFFDVRDAVNGLLCLIKIPSEKWKETYNLSNGACYSIQEIIASIEKSFERSGLPAPIVTMVEGEKSGCSGVDSKLFCDDTGFSPCFSLDDTVNWILDDLINIKRKNA